MAPANPLPARARYRAGLQAWKLVALVALSAACAGGAVAAGLDLGRTWGLREADGGVLRPLAHRLALGGGVAALGVAFLTGMVVYLRFYVLRVDVLDGGRTVRIGRLFPFPALLVPAGRVRLGAKVHRGGQGGALAVVIPALGRVRAPWLSLRVEGLRWPLLLDLKGRWEEEPGG
jgi:hypothetical protein